MVSPYKVKGQKGYDNIPLTDPKLNLAADKLERFLSEEIAK